MKKQLFVFAALVATLAGAETQVNVQDTGRSKIAVSIQVANQPFTQCLRRNLELSGVFRVDAAGTVRVTGASGAVQASGAGKALTCTAPFSDQNSAYMAARQLADAMCMTWANQKGFACDKILFLNRGNPAARGAVRPAELCVAYPDGLDIRQLTSDARMAVFPRWKDKDSVMYISDRNGAPQVWEMNTATGRRFMKWSFKGSPDGIAISPDGARVAAILSIHGNPELYVITGDRFIRLTETPLASEGQPTWSPDGRKIAYVSNETRHPQIYVVDVATRQKRRLTSRGRENLDPDWGADGRIAYITKRGGAQVAVMDANAGDANAQLVTAEGGWEHPSWSRNQRHLAANRDKALFIVDAQPLPNGKYEAPKRLFSANGNFISPCWAK